MGNLSALVLTAQLIASATPQSGPIAHELTVDKDYWGAAVWQPHWNPHDVRLWPQDVSPFVDVPNSPLDQDHDGLRDDVEHMLATGFRPYLVFDEGETRAEGTVFLYEMAPRWVQNPNYAWAQDLEVVFNIAMLYPSDSMPAGWCGHQGDSVRFEMILAPRTKGDFSQWKLKKIDFYETAIEDMDIPQVWYSAPEEGASTIQPEFRKIEGGSHVMIYVSENKHSKYATHQWCEDSEHCGLDEDCSPDGVSGEGILMEFGRPLHNADEWWNHQYSSLDGRLTGVQASVPGNVGSPFSYPWIVDLGYYGYPGENAIANHVFCGSRPYSAEAFYDCADPVRTLWHGGSDDGSVPLTGIATPTAALSVVSHYPTPASWRWGGAEVQGEFELQARKALLPTDSVVATADFLGTGRNQLLIKRVDGWRVAELRNGVVEPLKDFPYNNWIAGGDELSFYDHVVAVGQFDTDGTTDILLRSTTSYGHRLRWLSLTFTGIDQLWQETTIETWGFELQAEDKVVGAGDIDGNGFDDVVMVRGSGWNKTHYVLFMHNYYGWTFAVAQMFPATWQKVGDVMMTPWDSIPAVADLDGDGQAELLIKNPWRLGVLGYDNGTWQERYSVAQNQMLLGGWRTTYTDSVEAIGDFDGDGLHDLLVRSGWGVGMLSFKKGTLVTLRAFSFGSVIDAWWLSSHDVIVDVGDFSGGGKAELLIKGHWGIGVVSVDSYGGIESQYASWSSSFGAHFLDGSEPLGIVDADGSGAGDILFGHGLWFSPERILRQP